MSVEIHREDLDKYDQLRQVRATVGYRGGDDPALDEVGIVTGWASRSFDPALLAAAGDVVGPQATVLTLVAEEIIDAHPGMPVAAVLLVDRVALNREWRGHGLSTAIIDKLLTVLQLDPDWTLVLLKPEPLDPDGSGPLQPGHERDTAMVKLRALLYAADYRPWKRGLAWWRPLPTVDDEDID